MTATDFPAPLAMVPLAVIFDYGKVLSEPPDVDAHSGLVKTAGVTDEVFEEHYWAHRHDYDAGTLNATTYWQRVAAGAGFALTPERLAALHHYDALMWANLNAAMLRWATDLQAIGIKTAILSNMGEVNLAYMRKNFPWLKRFTHLTWSCELRTAKPDPAIYHHTLQRLDVAPGEALFIDDLARNVDAACALGIDAILFTGVADLRRTLEARGLAGRMPLPDVDESSDTLPLS